jgi:DNA-binding GntR family transcriptional regulator
MIDCGLLSPGQRLIEADLTEQLGATRGAVREALRFLAGDGVVELVPQRGARIRRIAPEHLAQMLEVFSGIFFAALEVVAKRFHDGDDIDGIIANALRDCEAAFSSGSLRDKASAAFRFHMAIFEATGNPYFVEAVEKLHVQHYVRHAALNNFVESQADYPEVFKRTVHLLRQGKARDAYDVLRTRSLLILNFIHPRAVQTQSSDLAECMGKWNDLS